MSKVIGLCVVALGTLGLAVAVVFLAPHLLPGQSWIAWVLAGMLALGATAFASQLPPLWRAVRSSGDAQYVPITPGAPEATTPITRVLAVALNEQLADSPYQVLLAPGAVRIEWNTGDTRYRSFLLNHRTQALYRTTLREVAPRRFERTDQEQHYDSTLGRLHTSTTAGRVIRFDRRVDLAVNAEGITTPVDYALDSRFVDRAVKASLATVQGRTTLDVASRVGLMGAALGVAVALFVAVAFILVR